MRYSGMRYTSAQDGASEYSLSEKMRVRLRRLNQDIVNSQTGANLVRTAEGGIQEIIDNLREMKALAINAANDHNTDVDRQIIQKEQDSRLAVINEIAATTNYNGRLLLNGNLRQPVEDGMVNNGRNTRAAAIGTDALESSNANLEISGLSYLEASCGNIEISAHKIYGKITTDSNGRGVSIGHSTLDRASSGRVAITANYIFLATKTATASKGNFSAGAGSGATIWTDGGATVNGEAFNIDGRSYSSLYTNRNVYEYDDGTVDENGIYHGEEREEEYPGLIIHTGTMANENLRIFINSMDTNTMGISDIQMDPFERALEALSKLNDALEYSLNENTRMGHIRPDCLLLLIT